MSSVMFSSGSLFAKDASGNVIKVGIVQDVSLEFKGSTKELRGGDDFPVAVAQGGKSVTGKVGFAQIDGGLIAKMLGGTSSSGRNLIAEDESHAASASVDASNKITFIADLGVLDKDSKRMTKVASNPQVGEYTVTAGAYGFNAGQTGDVYLSYQYSVLTGETVTISQGKLGTVDTFSLHLNEAWEGKALCLDLFAVVFPSFSLGFKNEDFATESLDFTCYARPSDKKVAAFYVE